MTSAPAHPAVPVSPALQAEIEAFLWDEAELLDQRRFEAWLALFAEDGRYWMPSVPDQADPLATASIFYEDKNVLAIRIRRFGHAANVAQEPFPRTSHLLGRIRVVVRTEGTFDAVTPFQVLEYRAGDGQRHFAGTCRYTLRRDDGLKIVLKRVDLIDCDAPRSFLTVPI